MQMENYGFVRVAAAKPLVRPGDVTYNVSQIKQQIEEAESKNVAIMVFPELSIPGYTCADLFFQSSVIEATEAAIADLLDFSSDKSVAFAVGAPFEHQSKLYNCAFFIKGGSLLGIVPKTYIPNYGEFYERRWFAPGKVSDTIVPFRNHKRKNVDFVRFSPNLIFDLNYAKVGMEICEDLWVPIPPSSDMVKNGANIILNLSASDELAGKHNYLKSLITQQSARGRCGYVYASCGSAESSTDLAFSGNCIIAESGSILSSAPRFSMKAEMAIADIDMELLRNDRLKHNTFNAGLDPSASMWLTVTPKDAYLSTPVVSDPLEYRHIDPTPFVEHDEERLRQSCAEISSIQAWGLAQRLKAINCRNAVIGISGGLDSTLALLVTVKAFDMLGYDRKGILGVTMPGFGTTGRTHGNAWRLMEELGITAREIPINEAVEVHFRDINHNPDVHDATYENSQARERTQILMDLANQTGGIVIGTGDLSELALGWCTYNGDQMSMYGVNASVPKTLVRDLVKGYMIDEPNEKIRATLADIIDTPISPELLPAAKDGSIAQKTEDTVGPYELHDFFLFAMLRHGYGPAKILKMAEKAFKGTYDRATILKWLRTFYRRFFSQQFKRSCMPDGVKVGSVCLSPRGDWRMPSDASAAVWMEEIDHLERETFPEADNL